MSLGRKWQGGRHGKNQYKEESSKHDDKDPGEEVQSISKVHQASQEVRYRTSLGESHVKSQKGGESTMNEVEANFYKETQ